MAAGWEMIDDKDSVGLPKRLEYGQLVCAEEKPPVINERQASLGAGLTERGPIHQALVLLAGVT